MRLFAARGVVLDAGACRVLHAALVRVLAAERDRNGGGVVPAGTAHLLRTLAAGARDPATTTHTGTGTDAPGPVPGAVSGHEPDTFTVAEAAAAWGCTTSYVRRLCRQERIPAHKAPDGWRLPAEYVRAQNGPPRPENGGMKP